MKSLRALSPSRRRDADTSGDQGFTLIEMVVAIGLIGIVFAAVAAIMAGSLRALAVQKVRTQGNEVATQAIEDLQRRDFDSLVLCTTPSGTAPAGLDDVVMGSGCPASVAGYGEDPCNNVNAGQAPAAEYTCTRLNTDFLVKRFISWVDAGHTSKRLAVFVTWEDSAGLHEVSQQSSLRAPTAQSVIGLASPTLTNGLAGSVGTTYLLSATNELVSPVSVTVNSAYITSTDDRVFVKYLTLDTDGTLRMDSSLLTGGSASGLWTGTIPAGTRFPEGTQHLSFNAFRALDGKTTATISGSVKFCKTGGCTGDLPSITGMTVNPSAISIGPSGGLLADVTVSVTTTNVAETGEASVMLRTLAGVEIIGLMPQNGCSLTSCTWSGTVSKSAGHAFATDSNAKAYFTVAQPYVLGSTVATEQGSTESDSIGVSFA